MKKIFAITLLASTLVFSLPAFTKEKIQKITVTVTENGFEPNEIKVKDKSHVVLQITRKTETTCATNIMLKDLNIKKDLPLNQQVEVDLGVLKKGDISFACGMNMITGHIIIN
jgi:plastocyanin domain-containing protein